MKNELWPRFRKVFGLLLHCFGFLRVADSLVVGPVRNCARCDSRTRKGSAEPGRIDREAPNSARHLFQHWSLRSHRAQEFLAAAELSTLYTYTHSLVLRLVERDYRVAMRYDPAKQLGIRGLHGADPTGNYAQFRIPGLSAYWC